MIQLRTDCLVFKTSDGTIPCSAEDVAVELISGSSLPVDPEVIRHAAAGVLHYFRDELGRELVTVSEFAAALAKVLRNFGYEVRTEDAESTAEGVAEADLNRLASLAGEGFELEFFRRLRRELRDKMGEAPRLVRFTGLRPCVKQLTGARRWSGRCERVSDQIVEYLRQCFREAPERRDCALIIK